MADVNVFDDAGVHLGHVSAEEVDQLPQGVRVATPDEDRRLALEAEHGGLAGQLGALGTGALSGATAGLSDVAISELGGRETLQAYEEIHGGARTIGQIGGGIASVAIPGAAAGRLATAGKLIGAPARAAARVGIGVERLAAPALGRIGGAAAGAAVEGGILGAGTALAESSIYDAELTGENLLQSVGVGALLGGGTALGLGGASRLLGAGSRKAADLIDRAMSRARGGGEPSMIAKAIGAASETLTGAPGGTVARFLSDADRIRLAQNAPEVIAQHTEDALRKLESVHAHHEKLREIYSGGLKGDAVRSRLPRGNTGAQRTAIAAMADEAEKAIQSIKKAPDLKKLRADMAETRQALANASPERAYMLMDDLKRSVGKVAYDKLGAGVQGASAKSAYRALDNLHERVLRPGLEDAHIFGDAGRMQKEINEAWAPMIRAGQETGAAKLLSRTVTGEKGLKTRVFNRESVAKALKGASGPEKQQLYEGLARYLDEGNKMAAVAERHGAALTAGRTAKEVADAAGEARKSIGRISEAESAAADMARVRQTNDAGAATSAALGYAIGGGPVGAAAGWMIGALRNPEGMLTKLAAAQQLAGGAARKVAAGADAVFARARPIARFAHAFDRPDDKRTTAERNAHLAARPDAVDRVARDQLAGLSDHAPKAVDAAVAALQRRISYLEQHRPRGYVPRPGADPLPPPREAQLEYDRRERALDDPSSVLRDIADGRLTEAAIDAIRTVYPAQYRQLQVDAAERYSAMVASGRDLPYTQRVLLGRLLAFSTDPTMDVLHRQRLTVSYAQQAPGDTGPGMSAPDPGRLSKSHRTESERLANPEGS